MQHRKRFRKVFILQLWAKKVLHLTCWQHPWSAILLGETVALCVVGIKPTIRFTNAPEHPSTHMFCKCNPIILWHSITIPELSHSMFGKIEKSSGGEESLTRCDCQMTNFWWLGKKWNYLTDILRDCSFPLQHTHLDLYRSHILCFSDGTNRNRKEPWRNKYWNIEIKSESKHSAPWFHLWAPICAK